MPKSITEFRSSLCKHPIPEMTTEEVLENIIESSLIKNFGTSGYNIKNKQDLLFSLLSFYNCPVCQRFRKIAVPEKEITFNIKNLIPDTIQPIFNENLQTLEVYLPLLLTIYPQENINIDLGFSVELPKFYKLQFHSTEEYLILGLHIQAPLITYDYKRIITLYIHNKSDKIINVSRNKPIGNFSIERTITVNNINIIKD